MVLQELMKTCLFSKTEKGPYPSIYGGRGGRGGWKAAVGREVYQNLVVYDSCFLRSCYVNAACTIYIDPNYFGEIAALQSYAVA